LSSTISESESLNVSPASDDLIHKAETLIEFRNYQVEDVTQTSSAIDIETVLPDSDETVIMRIVTDTNLKNNGVGVKNVKATEQLLTKPDIDKVIVFGNRFTLSARSTLQEEGIEFFSPNRNILSALDQHELYNNILRE
jgi:hypothetical protein